MVKTVATGFGMVQHSMVKNGGHRIWNGSATATTLSC
jgi:hypothetical protein